MRKLRISYCLIFFLLANFHISYAMLISFLTEDHFQGVDNIWGFSTTDQLSNLDRPSLSLLNGAATLTAWTGNGQESGLTQRGTRGLGILGGGLDGEIDWASNSPPLAWSSYTYSEYVFINFNSPVNLEWVEFRSFYSGEILKTGFRTPNSRGWIVNTESSEEGVYRFEKDQLDSYVYNRDSHPDNIFTSMFFGFDEEGGSNCHFSLARLEVTPISPIPEPSSSLLLGTGLLGLLKLRRRK